MPRTVLFRIRMAVWAGAALLICWYAFAPPPAVRAQTPAPDDAGPQPAEQRFERDMAAAEKAAPDDSPEPPKMTLIDLYFAGGVLMHPILLLSLVAAAFGIERALALRRSKVIPPGLIEGLGVLSSASGGLDPRKAYRLCQQFPSAASTVIRAMLLKIGRPHSEVEHAVSATSDSEATRLYGNVRPIALAVQVAPLLGLLGTVQGMIMAFYDTAYAPVGVNKATHLATGIYVALITTFGGLCVAIPAAVIVHLLEGRITRLFRDIDELAQSLLPQVERYEGKLRISHQQFGEPEVPVATVAKPAPAAAPPSRAPATKP